MSSFYKVLWENGMQLLPQLFQQQDLYFENLIKFYYSRSHYFWGIDNFVINKEMLQMSKLNILHASGILPDGTYFDTNLNTNSIPCVDLSEDVVGTVYLGVKSDMKIGEDINNNQYSISAVNVQDNIQSDVSASPHSVKICKLNLRILFESDSKDGYCYMPVLQMTNFNNIFALDQQYIYPCITVAKSDILVKYIKDIIDFCQRYIELNKQQLNSNNAIKVSILQSVIQLKGKLIYFCSPDIVHPYELFKLLIEFMNNISIFIDFKMDNMKILYDHNNIYKSFDFLIKGIIQIFVDLNRQDKIREEFHYKDGIFLSEFHSHNIDNVDLFVQIECEAGQNLTDMTINESIIRVAEYEQIKNIVLTQVSGLPIKLEKNLSRVDIPVDSNSIYFSIKQEGQLWERVKKHRNLGIYCSKNLINISIKSLFLWIIRKNTE